MKISNSKEAMTESMILLLGEEYGKEAPLTLTHRKIHEYLGMKIDCFVKDKIRFSMCDYINSTVAKCPNALSKGPSLMPAVHHLFTINNWTK